jgi:pimeloyl-ACP methyl ester carboxylesterase
MQVKDPEAGNRRGKITVPVYSIFGTADKYLSVAADKGGCDFVENFQSVYLEVVSHWSPEEKPAEINTYIDNYLNANF